MGLDFLFAGLEKICPAPSVGEERGAKREDKTRLFQLVPGEIVLRQLGNRAGEEQQGNQVGNGHEAVESIGNVPHQRAGADGAHNAHEDEDDVEDAGHDLAALAQIAPATGPVIAPADDGGQGEEQQADLNDDAADAAGQDAVEGGGRRGAVGAVCADAARIQNAGEDHRESGDGADDDGIDEDFEHAPDGLLAGLLGGGGRVGHGRRAEAGLVGEHAPGKAVLHGQHDGIAEDAASHCLEAEGALDDQHQGRGDLGDAQEDDQDAGRDVEHGHHRHQIGGDRADTLDAADQHEAHQHCQDDAGHQLVETEEVLQGRGDLGALGDVADAEAGQPAEDREDDGQPFPALAQAVFNIVHGTAVIDALLVGLPILDGQGDLGVLGAHAEESGDPHPEHGAGTAGKERSGDAGDVAGADGARQRGGDGLERGEVAAVVLILLLEELAHGVFHDPAEVAGLDEAAADGQIHARAHQKKQHDRAPGEAVEDAIDGGDGFDECFHMYPSFPKIQMLCALLYTNIHSFARYK